MAGCLIVAVFDRDRPLVMGEEALEWFLWVRMGGGKGCDWDYSFMCRVGGGVYSFLCLFFL